MELVTWALGSLHPKLGELLKHEYGLQKGVKQKIEKLSRELEAAHTVLCKIGDVPVDQLDKQVKLWASEVREASYDMEDIVDTFLVRVEDGPDEPTDQPHPHMLRRLRKKVGRLFKKSKARRNISNMIQEMSQKLEEVAARRARYKLDGIVPNPVAANNAIDPRILNLYKRATELVGIEGPKGELMDMLSLGDDGGDMADNKKMKMISIVGVGGLGKTTLAKAVYDQLKPHFKWGAFIPVGRNPDIKKVLRDILIGLDKEKFMNFMNFTILDQKQLTDELKEFVQDKRCFIVIDDIWDEDSWELIRRALQGSNYASRFIITTRISKVAAHADEVYKIQPLSRGNSEKLLFARISDSEGKKYLGSPSAEACEKILKKCSGVPLAIITIASLLASRPGDDWSEVYNSIGFGHDDNDDVTNTRRILSFSYYDLPSHLKACLLYLSVFPEDRVIEKNGLIWKWIAEGFISEEQAAAKGVGLFELGQRCFNELINRNMILPQETGYEGYVDACSVHDMVLDLILQLSSEENFVTALYGGERPKLEGSISRRLALQCVEEHNAGQLANITVEKVRSIFSSSCDFYALCPRLPLLRVAEMEGCSVSEDCGEVVLLPHHLGSLLHLRYLRLQSITKLPGEVRYLRFLQTLDLGGSSIEELPEEVGLLTQLVCLRVGANRGMTVPAGLIGKMRSLQELRICGGGEQFVKELGLLRELRVLQAWILVRSKSMGSALLESLGHLHKIQELKIDVSLSDEYFAFDAGRWVASFLHLRFVRLESPGMVLSGLPAWIKSSLAPNLSYLHVKVVGVKEQDMETLAKLPELSTLILYSYIGTKSVVRMKVRTDEGGVVYFRKLRFLRIIRPSICFDLRDSECSSSSSSRASSSNNTIMPSLESLEFGVHVRSLKDVSIRLQLGFDKLLGFHNLGTISLQRVAVHVDCEGAGRREVEEAEAALEHAAAVHPKHPALGTNREQEEDMLSRYQEACLEMSRAPELVIKAWKLADIVGSGDIQILRMPDPTASSSKVIRLLYTDDGVALLAQSSNAVHRLWKWEKIDDDPSSKSSESIPPVFWQPENGILMNSDTTDDNPEEATACTALFRNGYNDYVITCASGGKVSLFVLNTKTFNVDRHDWPGSAPPTAATFFAIGRHYGIVAVGRDDSSIQIYLRDFVEVHTMPTGHRKKITGLAFSKAKRVLVSSGADAQLCVWSIDGWEKKKSRYIQPPSNHSGALVGDTMVQFHYDQTHLLVVHESQLAIYDWQLECLCSWFPRDPLPAPISSAVYSIGCVLVYAGFCDGAIGIFKAESLTLQCRIVPSAYIPSLISSGGETVYPTVVSTHPWKPNQIAVGMSDGAVLVLEPLDTDEKQVASDASLEVRTTSTH